MSVLFVVFIPIETGNNTETSSFQNAYDGKKTEDEDDTTSENDPLLQETKQNQLEDKQAEKAADLGEQIQCESNVDRYEIESESGSAVAVSTSEEQNMKKPDVKADEKNNTDNEEKSVNRQPSKVEEESEYISLEEGLQHVLGNLFNISTDVWQKSDDSNFFQVTFVVENEDVDFVLTRLTNFGIGSIPLTSVSIFPASYHTSAKSVENDDCKLKKNQSNPRFEDSSSDFVKSVKSRLTVAQVVEAVKSNSKLTFDFVTLIILAGIIAALGLVENSSVILVASMLVSPLMGPILGGIFGAVIRNGGLTRLGVRNEIIGLGLCILTGFLIGLIVSLVNINGTLWGSSLSWPTAEMQSRGELRSLWVGVLIALPSGAGVALSILGGNTGSLVGVAISASLLPPAVNSGMLLANCIVTAFKHPEFKVFHDILDSNNRTNLDNFNASAPLLSSASEKSTICGSLVHNDYEFLYTCNMSVESLILGIISLSLTLLNILCIFLMGIIVLKIKEVAPHTAVDDSIKKFWQSDIKVARETYKTMKTTSPEYSDLALLAKKISAERRENSPNLQVIAEDLKEDPVYQAVTSSLVYTSKAFQTKVLKAYSVYHTIGIMNTDKSEATEGCTTPSSTNKNSEKNPYPWMSLKNRTPSGNTHSRPHTAHISEGCENYFFPKNGPTKLLHERIPRGRLGQKGRFQISAVPEVNEES